MVKDSIQILIMVMQKMLVAKPEPLILIVLEWLIWSCQVSCTVRSILVEFCFIYPHQDVAAEPHGPGVLG